MNLIHSIVSWNLKTDLRIWGNFVNNLIFLMVPFFSFLVELFKCSLIFSSMHFSYIL